MASLDSIKKDARLIQERDGFGYCQALEIAARKAGFNTYAAAKAALQGRRARR
ncbi:MULTISPECIES: hypothetical protein [Stenotrophomonas]|uniref:hypothetical protein n=1 Tax=Stenotrophomonas TaxID=40323 RepID=UPI0015D40BAF|nr:MULTISPECIES: hypothetical protein [Stenotrophomonas]NYU00940.1 hypothetical protein [Stenotrophomonas sp. SbOxS2]